MALKKVLVLRFAGIGDVALMVPVTRALVAEHADVEVTVVTRPQFAFLFGGIERVIVFEADVDHKFKGFFGIRQLFRALILRKNFDVVIDLHDHVRTMILRNLFKLFGKRVVVFDKGRREKKTFARKGTKTSQPLPHVVERYHTAFEEAGFKFKLLQPPYLTPSEDSKKRVEAWFVRKELDKNKNEKWIGLAPFAGPKKSIWPVANYPKLLDLVLKKIPAKFFLFGEDDEAIQYFEDLQLLFPNHTIIVGGRLKLPQQATLMQHLDVMVSLDFSNTHLAALSGTAVLTFENGKHTDASSHPFGKSDPENRVVNDDLTRVSPEALTERILNVLR